MGELMIRRNRGFAPVRYQETGKTEKQIGQSAVKTEQRPVQTAGFTISETLRQLMTRVSRAENRCRESRRTLQTGESTLAEVEESLDRMAELARKAASGGEADRDALQAELERLIRDIDRMTQGAAVGGTRLFLDGEIETEAGAEALLYAVTGEALLGGAAAETFPAWLISGLAQDPPTAEALLAALGLDQGASGSEILAAVTGSSLEENAAVGYLAALYLGAVIAGGGAADSADLAKALDGLRQLLERTAEGVPLDQAVEQLTDGAFTSLADFQDQFTDGLAPGLQEFLVNLLLSNGQGLFPAASSLLTLLAGMEGMNLDLMMGLLAAVGRAGSAEEPAAAGGTRAAAASVLALGGLRVMGRDLSGVSFSDGLLTLGGTEDVTLQGAEQTVREIRVTGSGTVTLQNVTAPVLTAGAPRVRLLSAGRNLLAEVGLGRGTALTLGGGGMLRLGFLREGGGNILQLTGGAVVLEGETDGALGTLTVPAVLEGAASLAARAVQVRDGGGRPLEPFDLLWKALVPGWRTVTAAAVDGRQTKLALLGGEVPDPVRLWLAKEDPSHGHPLHTVLLRGRDRAGQPRTRYAYLHWNQRTGTFEEISMYPNPFAVTGGEPGRDWVYEEESQTLRILSDQVTAISGGAGTDAYQTPFSGRVVLADQIGAMELALGGVVCRVDSGRAFSLGRRNNVTLVLKSGTSNFFESGAGCAGICLGDGTSLRIDSLSQGDAAGTLTAAGRMGGAGIGRDSGAGRDRSSRILIRGGVISASGAGGGAGIGAGKRGSMGPITILGGMVTALGGAGGGAGIGAGLGAAAGDISIRGGRISASAVYHAAAIGAGVQGDCGDILIAGSARILKALGGNPGADIGACLFGGCGKVQVSGGADIGGAKLWTRSGLSLHLGEETVTLPQFRLSSRALQLDRLSVLTREYARAAEVTLDADLRWVAQIQAAYGALSGKLKRGLDSLRSVQQYVSRTEELVRDTGTAGALLEQVRRSIPQQSSQAMQTHGRRGKEDVGRLLR